MMRPDKVFLLSVVFSLFTTGPGWAEGRMEARPQGAGPVLSERWFFAFGYGRTPEGVAALKSLIDVGAAHGLNGMVLSSFGQDSVTRWNERDLALLREVQAHCRLRRVELIPTGFSVGYGGGAMGYDRNFAAALPVTVTLKAQEGRLKPVPGPNLLVNGDLEQHDAGRFTGYAFHDQPGEISFVETDGTTGNTAIRFENFRANEHGHGRIMQRVSVLPGRAYHFSYRIKTEALQPVSGLQGLVLTEKGTLTSFHPPVEGSQDWTEVETEFVTRDETEVMVYAGIWGGRSGRFWLDDFRLCEANTLADIVQREGAPLELRSQDRDRVFAQGRDFQRIANLRQLDSVRLLPDSGIREGEMLSLACYKIPSVSHAWGQQISLCMSNPDLYRYWEAEARRLHAVLGFKRILLSMDEIRNGGGCLACRGRGLSMGEILGDCITRLYDIFKRIDSEIEVLIWSDMLDPAHNAHDNYYGVVGDFTGSWRHVPTDLTVMCWYHAIRDKSLSFFSAEGFRTFGAAYYDADDLTNPREWLASLQRTHGAEGIMYTSWERKYDLLADFGDLVSGE